MAQAFNLTAQLNLQGPANIGRIVSDIKKQIGSIEGEVKFKVDTTTAKNIAQLNSSLQSFNSTLSNTTSVASNAAKALSDLRTSIGGINIKNVSSDIKAAATATDTLAAVSKKASKDIQSSRTELEEFGRQSALAIRRFTAFTVVSGIMFKVSNSINQGLAAAIDFERQMVKLEQITGKSQQGLASLSNTISNLSTSLGISSSSLISIADTLAQAGLSARDTETALKALALTELAPSFDSLNETVEGSIALMRQFDISANQLQSALGSINSVAARFAVESSDLITAIQRTGGVFATASKGVSEGTDALNEFLAVFTSVRATTRESAETIATGLRTIFTRIQREDTIEALEAYNVQLTDVEGKFIGAYRAVEQLSRGLGKLDPRSIEFSAIVEELGGFRQIGKVIPLIQQFAVAQEALKVAQVGQDSLAYDAVTAQKSLANQIVKVREQFLALIREIGQSDAFQSLAKGALTFASALISITDTVKGILPILAIIGLRKGISATTQFGKGFLGGLKKVSNQEDGGGNIPSNAGRAVGETLSGARSEKTSRSSTEAISALQNATNSISNLVSAINTNINILQSNTNSLNTNTASIDALTLAIQNFNTGAGPGLNSGGRVLGFASGGTVPGSGSKDTVPAMLTPGEFVLNKKAAKTFGSKNLQRLNRYAAGGVAQIKNKGARDGDSWSVDYIPSEDPISVTTRGMGYDAYEINKGKSWEKALGAIATGIADTAFTDSSSMSNTNTLFKSIKQGKFSSGRPLHTVPKSIIDSMIDIGVAKKATNENTATGFGAPNDIQIDTLINNGYVKEANEAINLQEKTKKSLGGLIQSFADGGVAQRKVGYIDYDVIANEANKAIVEKGMESTGQKGPRLYTDYLTQLAVKARKESNLQKLRAVYGVAGSGKTTLARGQGTDIGTLRTTERFPVLTPEDIQKATEIIVLSSSVSKDKLDNFFSEVDRAYTLSSTTKEEKDRIRTQRTSRDITGIGLEGRKPGVTASASTDTAIGEALLSETLGKRSVVLGRTESGKVRRKSRNELVEIIKKKIGFTWGGFAPMTAGHESIMDAAQAKGISPEDFIYLVGANEGIKAGDPSSYRTAVFDQDFRVLLAKAGAGAKGARVLPKPRDFEVPQAFDISDDPNGRRKVLIPGKGSRAFVADKTEEQTAKYKEAGYGVTNLERTGGISGTMVRELIMSGNMKKLQDVLSPGVYELISNNIGRLQNRANALPAIIEQVKATQGTQLSDVENQIKALGITRIDNKKVASDPAYAAQVEVLQELRSKRDKIKAAAGFEPYRLLQDLARSQPEKYGLDFSTGSSDIKPIRTVSDKMQKANLGGLIRKFAEAGEVEETSGRRLSRAEILSVLGVSGAAKAANIDATKVRDLLGLRRPLTSAEQAMREAIEKEYVKKINRQAGAAQATVTRLQARGLEFGAAGLFGTVSPPTNLDIQSDRISRSAKVRVISGVMDQNIANQLDQLFVSGTEDLAQRAAGIVTGGGIFTGQTISNPKAEASMQGGLLEKTIQLLGGPGSVQGRGFDFPDGLQGAARYFNLPPDIPTDLKRTLSGPSTIKENIVTYLKNVMGYADGGKVSLEDIRKQIYDKYPDYRFRINPKSSGFGYRMLARPAAEDAPESLMAFDLISKLSDAPNTAKKLIEQIQGLEKNRKFAGGGTVPALVSNGEAYIPPKLAKRIGYNNLTKMNHADKNGLGRFSNGGISVFKGPGTGTSDSIPTNLPVGSFILREKATKALGFNRGGSVGSKIYRFPDGGDVPAPKPSDIVDIDPKALSGGAKAISKAAGDLTAAIEYIKAQVISAAKEAAAETYKAERAKGATSKDALEAARETALVTAKAKAKDLYANREKNLENFKVDPNLVYGSGAKIRNKDIMSLTPKDLGGAGLGPTNPIYSQTTEQIKAASDAKDKAARDQRILSDQLASKNSTFLSLALGGLSGVVQKLTKNMDGLGGVIGQVVAGAATRTGVAREAMDTLKSRSTIRGLNLVGEKTGINQLLSKVGFGPLGSQVAFVTKALGTYGTAIYLALGAIKDFYNGMLESEKKLTENRIEQSTNRLSYLFDKMGRDIDKSGSIDSINNELNNLAISLSKQSELSRRSEFMWLNILDWMGQSGNLGTGIGERANQRGQILKEQGSVAYLQSAMSDLIGTGQTRQENYLKLAPKMIQQNAELNKAFIENNNKILSERLRRGDTSTDIMSELGTAAAPSARAKVFATQDIDTQLAIETIRSGNESQEEKNKQIAALEFEAARSILSAQIKFEEAKIISDKLNKISNDFVTSITRLMSSMDQAINKTTFELQLLSNSAKLSRDSLTGKAGAGQVNLQAINVLRNPMAYGGEDRRSAAKLGATPFGIDAKLTEGLLMLPNELETSMNRAINATIAKDRSAGEKKISTKVEQAAIDVIRQMDFGQNIESLLIKQTRSAFEESRKSGEDKISFRELAERIPALAKQIDAANRAQESAIRALELWQNVLNTYSEAMNRQVQDQIDINNYLSKASDIRTKGEMALADALGKEVSLRSKVNASLSGVKSMTGGEINPAAISANVLDLENTRRAEQQAIDAISNSSIGVTDNFQLMSQKLAATNLSLRENYAALENLANSSDIASSALSKIQEISNKIKAGETFIEKLITSSPAEINKLNKSFGLLSNNLQGIANVGSTAEERGQTLQLFNMISPLLGSGQQQNELKANVLQSMLQESGVALDSNLSSLIEAIKNPESLTEMQQAVEIYKSGVELQAAANTQLAEIRAALQRNDLSIANQQLIDGFSSVMKNYQENQLTEIAANTRDTANALKNGVPAVAKSSGGIIYASKGQPIFKPKGSDTVPAMLTPGEFVVNKSATSKNLSLLHSINNGYANGGRVSYYADGGAVAPFGKVVSGEGVYLPETSRSKTEETKKTSGQISDNKYPTEDYLKKLLTPTAYKTVVPDEVVYGAPELASIINYKELRQEAENKLGLFNRMGILPDATNYVRSVLEKYIGNSYELAQAKSSIVFGSIGEYFNAGSGNRVKTETFPLFDQATNFEIEKNNPNSFDYIPKSQRDSYKKVLDNIKTRDIESLKAIRDKYKDSIITNINDYRKFRKDLPDPKTQVTAELTSPIPPREMTFRIDNLTQPLITDKRIGLYSNLINPENFNRQENIGIGFDDKASIVSGKFRSGRGSINGYVADEGSFDRAQNRLNLLNDNFNLFDSLESMYKQFNDKNKETFSRETGTAGIAKNYIRKLLALYNNSSNYIDLSEDEFSDIEVDKGNNVRVAAQKAKNNIFPIRFYASDNAIPFQKGIDIKKIIDNMYGEDFTNYIYGDNSLKTEQLKLVKTSGDPSSIKTFSRWIPSNLIDKIVSGDIVSQLGQRTSPVIAKTKMYNQDPDGILSFLYNEIEPSSSIYNEVARRFDEQIKLSDKFGGSLIDGKLLSINTTVGNNNPFKGMFGDNQQLIIKNSINDLVSTIKSSFTLAADPTQPNPLLDQMLANVAINPDVKDYIGVDQNILSKFALTGDSSIQQLTFSQDFIKSYAEALASKQMKQAQGAAGVVSQDLTTKEIDTSLDEAKRTTLARIAYKLANSQGLNITKNPENIQDIENIRGILNTRIGSINDDTNIESIKLEAWRRLFTEISGAGLGSSAGKGRSYVLTGAGIDIASISNGGTPKTVPDPSIRGGNKTMYWDNTSQEGSTQTIFNNLLSREINLLRSRKLGADASLSTDVANQARASLKNGAFVKITPSPDGKGMMRTIDNQEAVLETYADIFRYALTPSNIFGTDTARGVLIDQLKNYYENAQGRGGQLIFERDYVTKINTALDTLKSWYSDQDFLLNTGTNIQDNITNYDKIVAERKMVEKYTAGSGETNPVVANTLLTNNQYGRLPYPDKIQDNNLYDLMLAYTGQTKQPVNKANGGLIYASNGSLINFQPKGTDTVPAMLTPGEFVVNRQSTSKNLPLLKAINKNRGGKISYYQSGGMVDGYSELDPKNNQGTKFLGKIDISTKTSSGILGEILKVLNSIEQKIGTTGTVSNATIRNWHGQNQQDMPIPETKSTAPAPVPVPRPSTTPESTDFPEEDTGPITFDIPEIPIPDIAFPDMPDWEPIPLPEAPIPEIPFPDIPLPPTTVDTLPEIPASPLGGYAASTPEAFPIEVFDPAKFGTIPRPSFEPDVFGGQGRFLDESTIPARQQKPFNITDVMADAGINEEDAARARARTQEDFSDLDSMVAEVEARRSMQSSEAGGAVASGISRAQGVQSTLKGVQEIAEAENSYQVFRGGLDVAGGIGDTVGFGPASIVGDTASLTGNLLDLYENPNAASAVGAANDLTSLAMNTAPAASFAGGTAAAIARPLGAAGAVLEIGRGAIAGAQETTPEAQLRTTAENAIIGALTGDATTGGAALTDVANTFGGNIEKGGFADTQLSAIEAQMRGAAAGAAIGTAILPGAGTAVGAVVGQGAAATGELYKSGSAYVRESAAARSAEEKTNRMLEESKTENKSESDTTYGLDIQEGSYVTRIAKANVELERLKKLQSEVGSDNAVGTGIGELIKEQESYIKNEQEGLTSLATQRANEQTTTLFELGPDSPEVKARIDQYNQRIAKSIDQLGNSMADDIDPKNLPSLSDSLGPGIVSTGDQLDQQYYSPNQSYPIYNKRGGLIYASNGALVNFQPKGTDTVPAMLTPGEFVINKDATQKHLGLLRAINSGEYSHGGLVNYLKNGGMLLPNYYQNGARVGPNSAGMSFDISTFMNKIIGQITSSITTAFQNVTENLQNTTATPGGVSTNIEAGINTIDQFVSRLDRIANTLKDIDIPPEIKIVGQHDVNVVINGDAVLSQLKPELATLVMNSIKNAFQQFKGNNVAWQDSFNFDIT